MPPCPSSSTNRYRPPRTVPTSRGTRRLRELVKERRGQDLATNEREVRRRLGWLRLFDEPADLAQPAVVDALVDGLAGDDAVAARLLRGDLHDGDDRTMDLFVGMDELAYARPVGNDDVVPQHHRKRLLAHQGLRHQDPVAPAQLLPLAEVGQL